MSEVKLKPTLPDPKASDKDGLSAAYDRLLGSPQDCILVIGLVKRAEVKTDDTRGGLKTPSVAFKHIEVVLPQDANAGEGILMAAYRQRTRQEVALPGMPGGDEGDEPF